MKCLKCGAEHDGTAGCNNATTPRLSWCDKCNKQYYWGTVHICYTQVITSLDIEINMGLAKLQVSGLDYLNEKERLEFFSMVENWLKLQKQKLVDTTDKEMD